MSSKIYSLTWLSFIAICMLFSHCKEKPVTSASSYVFIDPVYKDLDLAPQADSLRFQLTENRYNQIRSFNYFEHKGNAYMSFYDQRSESVNIYDFHSQQLAKTFKLKSILGKFIYKTSVFVKNMDSIFIVNAKNLFIYDTACNLKKSYKDFDFTDGKVYFDNTHPLIIEGNSMYASLVPNVDETSLESLTDWRGIYKYNLKEETGSLYYPLPSLYLSNLYGDNFLKHSFCFNDKGKFVFSFPADTNIYETDLANYHKAYYAKSKLQSKPIDGVPAEEIKNGNSFRQYVMRYSYGPVYFDAYKKRYLRLARRPISKAEYESNKTQRDHGFIVFDKDFKIIGEGHLTPDISYNTIFFTSDGRIYARKNVKDEYALHFVRLDYVENEKPVQLAKK